MVYFFIAYRMNSIGAGSPLQREVYVLPYIVGPASPNTKGGDLNVTKRNKV